MNQMQLACAQEIFCCQLRLLTMVLVISVNMVVESIDSLLYIYKYSLSDILSCIHTSNSAELVLRSTSTCGVTNAKSRFTIEQ